MRSREPTAASRRGGSAWSRRVALLALLLAAGAFAWTTTHSSFTATTKNTSSSVTAGSVSLSDDDGGSALFGVSGLTAGSSGTKCIVVTYGGSLAALVHVYATGYTQTSGLARFLDLTITQGSGSSFAGSGPTTCSGFTPGTTIYTGTLDSFATAAASYASGVGTWAPTAAGQTITYRFTYTLDPRTPNAVASGTAAASFTWEAHNS